VVGSTPAQRTRPERNSGAVGEDARRVASHLSPLAEVGLHTKDRARPPQQGLLLMSQAAFLSVRAECPWGRASLRRRTQFSLSAAETLVSMGRPGRAFEGDLASVRLCPVCLFCCLISLSLCWRWPLSLSSYHISCSAGNTIRSERSGPRWPQSREGEGCEVFSARGGLGLLLAAPAAPCPQRTQGPGLGGRASSLLSILYNI